MAGKLTQFYKDPNPDVDTMIMLNELRRMEKATLDHQIDLKDKGDLIKAKIMDEVLASISRAITAGEKFLIG